MDKSKKNDNIISIVINIGIIVVFAIFVVFGKHVYGKSMEY
jgi:hypothetical protein